MANTGFRRDLTRLINVYSREGGSNTPDFILAAYIEGCLENFDRTMVARENWYGRTVPGDRAAPTNISVPLD